MFNLNRNYPVSSDKADLYENLDAELKGLEIEDLLLVRSLIFNTKIDEFSTFTKDETLNNCLIYLDGCNISKKNNILEEALDSIINSRLNNDETEWINKNVSRRLEHYLRNKTYKHWIDTNSLSTKQKFKIAFRALMLEEDKIINMSAVRMRKIRDNWKKIEGLNEFKSIKKEDIKELLIYISAKFQKIQKNGDIDEYLSCDLDTLESALICLDSYSEDPAIRSFLIKPMLTNWTQKNRREKTNKKQKNFILAASTIKELKKLSETHELSETQIISLLIKQEANKGLYIEK